MKKRTQTELQRANQVISRLKNENKELRETVTSQALEIKLLREDNEYLKLQIEELRKIIFGDPKKGMNNGTRTFPLTENKQHENNRPPESYRRSIPQEDEITHTAYHTLPCCVECQGEVSDLKQVERYVEDILPMSEWYKALKTVTKELIETAYCSSCKKRVASKPLAPQNVSLGENVQQFITFSTIILRLSYEQIGGFLESTTKVSISDGEISNILKKQAGILEPAFERLKERIRLQPGAHYDETSWKVQKEGQGNYAWVMTGTQTTDTVFLLGRSRGKGTIDTLRGKDNFDQIGISDNYGAYKNSFTTHALCWAHPFRKLRDLKHSDSLSLKKQKHCKKAYDSFAQLYSEVQAISLTSFNKEQRMKDKEVLLLKFEQITQPHPLDPLKLCKIKKSLLEQKECYFVCILHKGIPLDNNKAERALRHLVLKRKNSYGSKTQAGADCMGILYSVLLSAWWKSKKVFFQDYAQLLLG